MNTQSLSHSETRQVSISGMSCASCVTRVEKALLGVPSVVSAQVNLATEQAALRFDGPVSDAAIRTAVEAAGYQLANPAVELGIAGMTCASCVSRVEQALQKVPGVREATVNLATERALVKMEHAGQGHQALLNAVEQAGYHAQLLDSSASHETALADKRQSEAQELRRAAGLAAVLSLPLLILEMGGHLVPAFHHAVMGLLGASTYAGLQALLATLVLFGPGLRFWKLGVPSMLRGHPDMNSLVVLGAGAAWAYSMVATLLPKVMPEGAANLYFEAAAVIITLILLGRWLEARAKGRTGAAIQKLLGLQAKTAMVMRDGQWQELGLEQIGVGDEIMVRPGEQIALDGIVSNGESWVDESMLSGEPVPVSKHADAEVTGGTLNGNGSLIVRVSRVGADTVLSQIIRMVQAAQGTKLPIQALVDRVAAVFVPVVIAVALLTFGLWWWLGPESALAMALVNAVAVLIIACPCAMGLATPTSIMVGIGRAAELGVFFRQGDALQRLRDARVVAFDKTGTLTEGKPSLTDLQIEPGNDEPTLLAAVAALESRSEHPLALALVAAAEERGLKLPEIEGFEAISGYGVQGRVNGQLLQVGADRYMQKLGIPLGNALESAQALARAGRTPIYVATDGKLAAVMAVADSIRPVAAEIVSVLHQRGLQVAMITGDNRDTAQAVAKQLGVDQVIAGVLPGGKVEALQRLRSEHGPVVFVGDGINDAPALAEADIGIAVGTGTDVAIESADVVLMAADLRGVGLALEISAATIRNIRQNLFWAFAYNASLIPVAAGALYPWTGWLLSPMLASGAMALSSVFVVSNALRLRRAAAH